MEKRQKKYHLLDLIYSWRAICAVVLFAICIMMFMPASIASTKIRLLFLGSNICNVGFLVLFHKFVLLKNSFKSHYLSPCIYPYPYITYASMKKYLLQSSFQGSFCLDKPPFYQAIFFHKRKRDKLYKFTLFYIEKFDESAVKSMREAVRRKQKQFIDKNDLDYIPWYASRWHWWPSYQLHLFITETETTYVHQLMSLNGTSNAMRDMLQAIYCIQTQTLYIPACFGGSIASYTLLHKDLLCVFDEVQ